MALFQQSVIKKHIESLDSKVVEQKWQIYTSIFHNSVKQNNIRNSKEEQFQEGFLRELFVNVLGYTINPDENFNLLTELKNVNNSKKADGAIIIDGKAIAVIELKGTETTDLGKIEIQAFGYKNNQSGCNYVITSNFEKLRFYIDNTTQLEEFNLFTLNKERFQLLYACLAWDSIRQNTPIQILNESVSKENVITKKLYNDYSEFKRALFSNLVELNPQFDKLLLFKKSQKLLDRFLFIFFAEDRLLLPTNLIFRINAEWDNLVSARVPVSLYDRYKMYFNDLNQGAKVTLPAFGKKTGEAITAEFEIFAYNGGLFQPDEILDTIKIDDTLLYNYTQKMSDYNFESDVDVNILGHIFENSLNEIDEVKSEIEGTVLEKTKTRRKKDGVFYTPKYITKYIVDNTIGKLCLEKKEEIKLRDEDYITDKKLQSKTKKGLLDKLAEYRNWLLDLTICDPACGSGAFLNQALEFLIAEHRYIDELQAKLMGDAMILSDIENSILERNIYGVDLNDESVEIAKLSLWLRTAQKGRKLNSLTNNIKCGNSLIDDVEIAGEKAFSWEKEFPDVFAKGGFDVIIGNPPYGANISKDDLEYIVEKHKDFGISNNLSDTYFSFYSLSLRNLLTDNGVLGFITPNTWRLIDSAREFRNNITNINRYNLYQVVQHLEKVFSDATVDCDTLLIKKSVTTLMTNILITSGSHKKLEHSIQQEILSKQDFLNLFLSSKDYKLKEKITKKSSLVSNDFLIKNGVKPYEKGKGKPPQTAETLIDKPFTSEIKIDDSFSPLIGGSSFHRYKLLWKNDNWIQYGEWLAAPREKEIFNQNEKLIFRQTSDSIIGALIGSGYIIRNNTHILLNKENSKQNLKYALCLLNSSLSNWYYWTINPEKGEAMAEVKAFHLGMLPYIKQTEIKQQLYIEKVDKMLSLNEEFQTKSNKFSIYFSSKYLIERLPSKLEKWYELEFLEFVKELNKSIKALKGIPLTKKDEFEWIDLFEENKQKALSLKAEIDKTDNEIDRMVYDLYELTEEEIKIIENN